VRTAQLEKEVKFEEMKKETDWRDFSDDKVPESIAPFEKSFSAILYCTLASMRASALSLKRKLLAKEKRAFLGFFSLRGSYQYGMFGNESTYIKNV